MRSPRVARKSQQSSKLYSRFSSSLSAAFARVGHSGQLLDLCPTPHEFATPHDRHRGEEGSRSLRRRSHPRFFTRADVQRGHLEASCFPDWFHRVSTEVAAGS